MKYAKLFMNAAACAVLVSGLLTGCGGTKSEDETTAAETAKETVKETTISAAASSMEKSSSSASKAASEAEEADDGNWAIYMYVCGSDLESDGGLASDNLLNLMNSARTDDTVIVAQTGGTTEWQNNFMDEDKTQRWLYTDGDMQLVDEQELADMGDSDTLADFLSFAANNYPADHTMVIFWDHGGGTLNGCCKDEVFNDTLSLTDIHDAFDKVYNLSKDTPPVDVLGFDCCLMATIDVADTFSDTAHYLVASEETEPGEGWNYTAIGDYLGENPYTAPKKLGIEICDSYLERLEEMDEADTATLSLTDLSKIGALKSAFNTFADDMIVAAYEDPISFRDYTLYAKATENYGGNSRAEGYYDLVDIKDFAENLSAEISSARNVLKAINQCVVYKVNGEYRSYGGGLSFYYDFDGLEEENEKYNKYGTVDGLKVLYQFGVTGTVNNDEGAYMKNLGLDPNQLPDVVTFANYDSAEHRSSIRMKELHIPISATTYPHASRMPCTSFTP